jgi:hypothetical protein
MGFPRAEQNYLLLLPDRPREDDVVMSTLSPQVGKPCRPPVQNRPPGGETESGR